LIRLGFALYTAPIAEQDRADDSSSERNLNVLRFAVIGLSAAIIAGSASAAPPKSDVERVADASDKVICKRFARTGSLADSYRTCKTKGEWDRERDNVRQLTASEACRMRGEGGGC
jgi:hypothetical protein